MIGSGQEKRTLAPAATRFTYLEEAGHFVIAGDYGPMGLRLYLFPLVVIV